MAVESPARLVVTPHLTPQCHFAGRISSRNVTCGPHLIPQCCFAGRISSRNVNLRTASHPAMSVCGPHHIPQCQPASHAMMPGHACHASQQPRAFSSAIPHLKAWKDRFRPIFEVAFVKSQRYDCTTALKTSGSALRLSGSSIITVDTRSRYNHGKHSRTGPTSACPHAYCNWESHFLWHCLCLHKLGI